MPDCYLVHDVSSVQPEWTEQMGSKPKFWFRRSEDGDYRWLFKFAREGTGEDWAEKVAAELAAALQIPAATVELAAFNGRRGSIARLFNLRQEGWDLVHGNELLAGCVPDYRRQLIFRQSQHTWDHIVLVLHRLFADPQPFQRQCEQFAGYLVLDALIGNTDRHHENWGVFRRLGPNDVVEYALAPSFDHASSLGREMSQEERVRRLREGSLGAYVSRGRGAVYLATGDAHGANPLELVRRVVPDMPEAFQPWRARLQALSPGRIQDIIEAVPDAVMDPTAKRFAEAFIEVTRTQLCTLL
jgi:hypothetical protein